MNREELKRYLGITGYSLGQVEKDYFQHIILSAISRKMGASLVFKGGTALQKCGVIPRFSEDLDFTATRRISVESIRETVERVLRTYNYPCETDKMAEDERSAGFRIKIRGPLYRNGRGISTIKIDISKRENLILPPQSRVLSPVYSDILPYPIKIMSFEEIAAEKIRAIYTRNRARDLYDLYKLIENGVQIEIDVIDRKLEYYNMKFEPEIFIERCAESALKWEKELMGLMETVPPKDMVLEKIEETAFKLMR